MKRNPNMKFCDLQGLFQVDKDNNLKNKNKINDLYNKLCKKWLKTLTNVYIDEIFLLNHKTDTIPEISRVLCLKKSFSGVS